MKYLKLLFLLCVTQHYGQHLISKQLQYQDELILVELEEIDELRIEQSPNAVLTIKMEGQKDILSSLDINRSPGLIQISGSERMVQTSQTQDKFCKIQPLYNVYTLLIPVGAQVSINYTDGNVDVRKFSGDLRLNLNRGDIHLSEMKGHCEISFFAGNVFASLKNTAFDINTNIGKFSTDLSQNRYVEKSHHYQGSYGNAKNFLKVKTVRANIALKAAENQ